MNSNFEHTPSENLIQDEVKANILKVASYFCMVKNVNLSLGQFVGYVYKDLDLKDMLKGMLDIKDDLTLFRTLLYLDFKGGDLKPKSLYRIFRNGIK